MNNCYMFPVGQYLPGGTLLMKNCFCIAGLIPRSGDIIGILGVAENGARCWEKYALGVDVVRVTFLCRISTKKKYRVYQKKVIEFLSVLTHSKFNVQK